MTFTWVAIIQLIAVLLWTFIVAPQAYWTVKTKNTNAISVFMAIFYPVSSFIMYGYNWAMYVIDWNPSMLSAIILGPIGIGVSLIVMVYKIINISHAKKAKLPELEYYKQYILNKKESKVLIQFEQKLLNLGKKLKIVKEKKETSSEK